MIARVGDVYENPVTGEHCVIVEGDEEGGGERVRVLLTVRPGGAVAGEHVHSYVTETFRVLEGELGIRLDGAEKVGRKEDEFVVPPGTAHDWWNAGTGEAKVLVGLTPPGRLGDVIVAIFALARDGMTNAEGRPNLLPASLLLTEFAAEARFTKPPPAVQRILFGILAPIARARGHTAIHDYGPPGRIDPAELAELDRKYDLGVRAPS